ncbi:hypothetical protein GA0070624_6163 [Micromonospora rhizosphaerae]|uniref:Uncharacterized protein n=1 Tax=Micromonospora rhizosphaerae TaxID=568872 RepID=A0A1C6T9G4_9ACTN|nr:hypothetical protein GA0070624_6163 [Micromonospora rhizosphaerae]
MEILKLLFTTGPKVLGQLPKGWELLLQPPCPAVQAAIPVTGTGEIEVTVPFENESWACSAILSLGPPSRSSGPPPSVATWRTKPAARPHTPLDGPKWSGRGSKPRPRNYESERSEFGARSRPRE